VHIRCFWQGNHHTYGHIRCVYTVLANPICVYLCVCVSPSVSVIKWVENWVVASFDLNPGYFNYK
jgi:hypothetical protein